MDRTTNIHGLLAGPAEHPAGSRAASAADALVRAGARAACAMHITDPQLPAFMGKASGAADGIAEIARPIAERMMQTGRAIRVVEMGNRALGTHQRFVGIACGSNDDDGAVILVVNDEQLPTYTAEAIAVALSNPTEVDQPHLADCRACSALTRDIATEFDAGIVGISLFSRAGMRTDLHVRSGELLRRTRLPLESVWGDAARAGAAFNLADLRQHRGMESLGSIGMSHAAVVALENEAGVPVGAVGVAAPHELPDDISLRLLDRSRDYAREVMQAHARSRVSSSPARPVLSHSARREQHVELRELAARIGCHRVAIYQGEGEGLGMVGCFAGDGSSLVSPPDAYEEELVRMAAYRGVSVVTEQAAVVLLSNGVLIYASDSERDPMEAIQFALQDLLDDPYGDQMAA